MRDSRPVLSRAVAILAAAVLAAPALAGVMVYEEGAKKIEIGGRVQIEYLNYGADCPDGVDCLLSDSDLLGDDSFDRIFFRRLRPYIAGSLTENWMAKIEFDFGAAEDADEVQVKDAFFRRKGFGGGKNALTLGNAKAFFAREFLNSSSSLQLVERGFGGDHNFGVPDRALGAHWSSQLLDGKLGYGVSAGAQHHDPAVNRMDFDTPVNNAGDWNEGGLVAGRIDYHPLGYQKFSQGDFDREGSRFTIGAGAFAWANDGDNNTYTDDSDRTTRDDKVDLDRATGYEISAAYRGHGFSADAAFQIVTGHTVDETFTGGMYRDGQTDLTKFGIVAGYMFRGETYEIVAGWDSQDADNYEEQWTRMTGGVNFYFDRHNLKLQLDYQRVESFIGIADQDHNLVLASTQFKF